MMMLASLSIIYLFIYGRAPHVSMTFCDSRGLAGVRSRRSPDTEPGGALTQAVRARALLCITD